MSRRGTRSEVLSFDPELSHASILPYREGLVNRLRYIYFPPEAIESDITDDAVVARVPPSMAAIILPAWTAAAAVLGGLWWFYWNIVYDEPAYVASQLEVLPPPEDFRPEWSPIPEADVALLNSPQPQLYFLIGPKVVGKSYALEALPSRLQRRAIMVEFKPAPGEDVTSVVYAKLRTMARKHGPARPAVEATTEGKRMYIKQVCKGAIVLIDCRRSSDRDWAKEFSDDVRALWHGANVTVVATTSEGVDLAESKAEPRRHVRIVPELSAKVTEQALRAALLSQNTGWKASDPTPAYLLEAVKFLPRHFINIRELVQLCPTKEEYEKHGAMVRGFNELGFNERLDELLGSLSAARCPKAQPVFTGALREGGAVHSDDVVAWCNNNEEATKTLVFRNVLRPIQSGIDNKKGVHRYRYQWQYDCIKTLVDQLPAPAERKAPQK
jgi:hypothetical protein